MKVKDLPRHRLEAIAEAAQKLVMNADDIVTYGKDPANPRVKVLEGDFQALVDELRGTP